MLFIEDMGPEREGRGVPNLTILACENLETEPHLFQTAKEGRPQL